METQTTIEAVEIMNGELIDVLAQVAQYHRTNGLSGDPKLSLEGESERKFASLANDGEDYDLLGSEFVTDGELNDTVTVRGDKAKLVVL